MLLCLHRSIHIHLVLMLGDQVTIVTFALDKRVLVKCQGIGSLPSGASSELT